MGWHVTSLELSSSRSPLQVLEAVSYFRTYAGEVFRFQTIVQDLAMQTQRKSADAEVKMKVQTTRIE